MKISSKMGATNQSGFTLIELLVTVGIIGILSAIAVPQFSEYKTASYDARAESDLRNLVSAEEAYFTTNLGYLACSGDDCDSLPGFKHSDGTTASAALAGGGSGFTATARNAKGARVFNYSSITGQIVAAADDGGGSSMGG